MLHYENTTMEAIYTLFLELKIAALSLEKKKDFFPQNVYNEYMLEPPRRSGSNEYKQSMFWNKNEVGLKGVYISRTCFLVRNIYRIKK